MTELGFAAAFLVGLAGSLHCVGMCGPLAMVVPLNGNKWGSILSYNISRILVYIALGFLFGNLGARLSFLESGQRISLVLGIAVLVFFVVPFIFPGVSLFQKWNSRVTQMYGKLAGPIMRKRGWASPIWMGAINGVLPCGLIYVSLAGAAATGSGVNGAFLLGAIGLGTLPAMVSMMALRKHFKSWMQRSSRLALPIIAGLLGVSLVVRGLNLDIPYLSPKVEKVSTAAGESCE